MAEEPSKASMSSISIEYNIEPSVTRERVAVSILEKLKAVAPSSSDLSRKRKWKNCEINRGF